MKFIFLLLFLLGGFIIYKVFQAKGATAIALAEAGWAIAGISWLSVWLMKRKREP